MQRNYIESLAESKKLAQEVLLETAKYNIRPNPINFTVWYEYLLKRDPYIVDKFSDVLEGEHEHVARELYNHIVGRLCFMSEFEHVIIKLVNEIIDDIDGWEGSLDSHSVQLIDSLSSLSASESQNTKSLQVVQSVISCVQELISGSESMKAKMHTIKSEVNQLKHQLEISYREAHTDPLTGVANRRAFDKFIVEKISQTIEEKTSLSCLILDIDFFKRVNDEFGHLVGDSVLRYLAKTLKNMTKGEDLVSRFGGEEFIVVLPHTECRDAYALAQKIRSRIEQAKFNIRDKEKLLKFTVSIGVATMQKGEPIDNFLERADKALYMAKSTGRNRVIGEIDLATTI